MPVDVAQRVAAPEPQLLRSRQAGHVGAVQPTGRERVGRVAEDGAVQARLLAVPARAEDDRVQVDAALRCDQLDPHRAPVGLDAVAPTRQDRQREGLVRGVDGQVEVAVRARLPPDQHVDAPPAADPGAAAGGVEVGEDREHLGEGGLHRVRQTSSTSVTGPSLTSSTAMSAPNTPVSTRTPRARSAAHTASTSGSATGPGAAALQLGRRPLRASP